MTPYLAATAQDLAIRAGTYELRITQVLLFANAGGGEVKQTIRYSSSTMSGGVSIGITPLHQGSPAASATALSAAPGSFTFSGTPVIVGSTYIPPAQIPSIVGTTVITSYPGSSSQIISPLTLTVAPGSVFHVHGSTAGSVTVMVYFEELRLVGSY